MNRNHIICACIFALVMGTLSCNNDKKEVIKVQKITVEPELLRVAEGKTATITVTALPENATDAVFEWSSDDTSIATVNQQGVVVGVKSGSAKVTVKCGELSKEVSVEVFLPLTDITLSPSSLTLNLEILFGIPDEAQYEATPVPATSTEVISWESSNTAVAAVSETGLIFAVGEGNAVVTVQGIEGTVKKEIAVTVTKVGGDPVMFDKTRFQRAILPGDNYQDREGWSNIEGIWDDLYLHAGGSSCVPEGIQSFTFDLGITGNLAIFHLIQWMESGYPPFSEANVKKFEVWGCEILDESGSWDSWTKLMDCEVIKPSGLPEGQATQEDFDAGGRGQMFYNKNNYNVPVRYLRVRVLETWGGFNCWRIEEITLWGQVK